MFDGDYYIVQTHEQAKEGYKNIAPLEFVRTLKEEIKDVK